MHPIIIQYGFYGDSFRKHTQRLAYLAALWAKYSQKRIRAFSSLQKLTRRRNISWNESGFVPALA